ncbi:hypothetical protein HF521_005747 [Silurus meridionalis]|uniref:Uncharacterized protein n=1 Tax=Silurus meridionalis TaxID=175797 RepID=A0A8T0AYA4_SILME|nr:hypothetical protein HF521_005747 [Silurus meridionalis]
MMIQGSCLSRRSSDEEREHLLSASGEHEKEKFSLQCVDDPTPLDAIVYYGDKAFLMHHHPPVEVGEDV